MHHLSKHSRIKKRKHLSKHSRIKKEIRKKEDRQDSVFDSACRLTEDLIQKERLKKIYDDEKPCKSEREQQSLEWEIINYLKENELLDEEISVLQAQLNNS